MKRNFSRAEAIRMLEEIQLEDDETNYRELACEELEEELCLTGLVHDSEMGIVYEEDE